MKTPKDEFQTEIIGNIKISKIKKSLLNLMALASLEFQGVDNQR